MNASPFRDEAAFQAAVGTLAVRRYELLHYHTHDSRRSASGFPDSVFVGRSVLYRELKLTRKSRVSEQQKLWLRRLTDAGADACIWYADDYHNGAIDEQLAELAPRTDAQRRRTAQPPLAMRLAKRLYVKAAGAEAAKASLLWDAGVLSVHHGDWIARAHEVLAIVAGELPSTTDEHLDWLAAHDLGDAGVGAIFAALRSELTAKALLTQPPAA